MSVPNLTNSGADLMAQHRFVCRLIANIHRGNRISYFFIVTHWVSGEASAASLAMPLPATSISSA
jgi:hypothetical protein